jgi:hypothetical protein
MMFTKTLNDLMEFGHVVLSDGEGNVTDSDVPNNRYTMANEVVYAIADSDGLLIKNTGESDFAIEDLYPGWTLLRGFTGQHGYNGAILHPSECIGGGLERHIRENAGYYVAVIVDVLPTDNEGQDESENAGWAVAFKEA